MQAAILPIADKVNAYSTSQWESGRQFQTATNTTRSPICARVAGALNTDFSGLMVPARLPPYRIMCPRIYAPLILTALAVAQALLMKEVVSVGITLTEMPTALSSLGTRLG